MKKTIAIIIIITGVVFLTGCKKRPDIKSYVSEPHHGNGIFSVSSSKKIRFAQGNLRYYTKGGWSFAEYQYEYIGNNPSNTNPSHEGWFDLFGWGTGDNPTNVSTDSYDYTQFVDWGNNTISNGGTTANSPWHTLTWYEWDYLLKRNTSSGIIYVKAKVNGINGAILLPDDWSESVYTLNSPNDDSADFSVNTISQSDWYNKLEANGAVFLPAAGYRNGTTVSDAGYHGGYWTATSNPDPTSGLQASVLHVGETGVFCVGICSRAAGCSVRLVCNVEN